MKIRLAVISLVSNFGIRTLKNIRINLNANYTYFCPLSKYAEEICGKLCIPALIAAHFALCFTSCVVVLAFWSPSTAAHFAVCFNSYLG